MVNPNVKDGRVKIYTRQDKRSLDILKEKGRFINKEEYIRKGFGDISEFFIEPYDWFVKEASKIIPKPEDIKYPIWCAVDWRSCLKPIGDTLVYVLEVEEERIIYLDGSKWDFVINEHYVPEDNEDLDRYKEYLRKLGIDDGYGFLRGERSKFYPLEKRKVLDSRKRVFDIDDWNIHTVQANIWEIRKEDIIEVIRPGEKMWSK